MAIVPFPSFTDGVDLRYFIEPLNGPKGVASYLDRFPDELYNKSLNSRFMRFMYALLGPAGIGWLRQDLLNARLQVEASGAQLFDLERFYGDPFSFGKILAESFDDDVTGLLPAAVWDRIRAQDEAYRTRAIQFMQAARFGGSPIGMTLAATSGVGQNVEVVENYKFLFDNHADDPIGLLFTGKSFESGEFTVIPRPASSMSEIQTIRFDEAEVPLGTNPYTISFQGYTTGDLDTTSNAVDIQVALEGLRTIGIGNIRVTGGRAPDAVTLTFRGELSNQDVPTVGVTFLPDGFDDPVSIPVEVTEGVDPSGEVATVSSANRHNMQTALDYLRPVATYPTFGQGRSHLKTHSPETKTSSSHFIQVARYVTGNPHVGWPRVDNTHWIRSSEELEAPRLNDSRQQNYLNFHNVLSISAYTDVALADPLYTLYTAIISQYPSVHIGSFPNMSNLIPFFSQYDDDTTTVFSADKALPNHTEYLTITRQTPGGIAFINDIYPADYLNLHGVPEVKYNYDHFWASLGRTSGADILEIDLGSPQAVNFITFETTRKPINIQIDYDLCDQPPKRRFTPIYSSGIPVTSYPLFYDPNEQNPWEEVEFVCNTPSGRMIYTQFIRMTFTRRISDTSNQLLPSDIEHPSPDLFPSSDSAFSDFPWTIDVRNLRIGRNVAPS